MAPLADEDGELNPFQQAHLDAQRAMVDRVVAENEIKRENWRVHRAGHWAAIAVFVLSALVAIAIYPGASLIVLIVAAAQWRALTGKRTTIWDWLIRRSERE